MKRTIISLVAIGFLMSCGNPLGPEVTKEKEKTEETKTTNTTNTTNTSTTTIITTTSTPATTATTATSTPVTTTPVTTTPVTSTPVATPVEDPIVEDPIVEVEESIAEESIAEEPTYTVTYKFNPGWFTTSNCISGSEAITITENLIAGAPLREISNFWFLQIGETEEETIILNATKWEIREGSINTTITIMPTHNIEVILSAL